MAATSVHYSHAGHDFHVLWAARLLLGLINNSTGLQMVEVEGVSPEDAAPDDDWVQAVDVAEYFGGDSVRSAERVVFSQLKYSTVHAGKPWTAAHLTRQSKSGKRSVLRRLADVFQGLDHDVDRHRVIEKAVIRLVSNRKVDPLLNEALGAAKLALAAQPYDTRAGECFRDLPEAHREVLRRLQQASALSSSRFADFVRILDVSGCGVEGRAIQRLKLANETSLHVVNSPRAEILSIQDLVRTRMQPEGADLPGIRRSDVLIALGVSYEDSLFPARPRFQMPTEVVPSPDAAVLAESVSGSSSRRILAHGDAGVGKTTALLQLESRLPSGSIVIAYDCFGAGEYTNAGHERHLPEWALLQIINELALRCGTPVLVPNTWSVEPELWRHFGTIVEATASTLPEHALLVIAIDAADNAVIAARQATRKAFVEQLWTIDIPANARIVTTSRSHRVTTLNAPVDTSLVQLHGFDAVASAAHLRTRFPEADDRSVELFHENSRGNPRVQYYAIETPAHQSAADLQSVLARSSATPRDIFEDLVEQAFQQVPDPESAQAFLATLFVLNRAAGIRTIGQVEDKPEGDARSACRALVPGVVIDDDRVSFRDENFETFVRDRLGDERLLAAEQRVAAFYATRADDDEEAATRVADHMFRARQYDDLIHLAIKNEEPVAIQDELARGDTKRRRIELGLQAAAETDSPLEAAQLLVLAAEAARTRDGFANIIRSNPELAAQYADPMAVETLYLRTDSSEWRGPMHLRMAAVLSRYEESIEQAQNQLELAEAWLRRWSSLPDHDRRAWEIEAEDVAAGVEAVAALHGWSEARDWLLMWRPRSFVIEVGALSATRLAPRYTTEEIEDHLRDMGASAWQQAPFMVAAAKAGHGIRPGWRHHVARRLEAIPLDHPRLSTPPSWGIELCELMAQEGCGKARLRRLLRRLAPPASRRGYDDPFDSSRPALRALYLSASTAGRQVSIDDVIPPAVDDSESSAVRNRETRDHVRRELSPLLEILQIRADALMGTEIDEVELVDAVAHGAALKHHSSGWKRTRVVRRWARWAIETSLMASWDTRTLIDRVLSDAEETLGSGMRHLHVEIAPGLLHDGRFNALAMDLLDRVDQPHADSPLPTVERRDLLLSAAVVADAHELTRDLARDLFERAVNAARDIDDGVVSLMHLREHIAARIAGSIDQDRATRICHAIARSVEESERFVSDPGEILPYSSTIRSVTSLDPVTGFTLLSRWSHEDRASAEFDIDSVVDEAAKRSFVSPEQGLALLRLHAGAPNDAVTSVLALLTPPSSKDRERLVRAVNRQADWVERLPRKHLRVGMARGLVAWATEGGLSDLASIQRLRTIVSYANELSQREDSTPSYQRENERRLRSVSASTAGQAIRTVQNRLRRFADAFLDEDEVARIVIQSAEPLRPSERVTYLSSLVELAQMDMATRSVRAGLARGLRQVTEAWRSDTRVDAWSATELSRYLEDNLPNLLVFEIDRDRYRRCVEIPDYDAHRPLQHLIRASAKHLDSLSAMDRYGIAEAVVDALGSSDAASLLEWSLDELLQDIDADHPSSRDSAGVIAGFAWGLFGHPDKRTRWRTAHACREVLLAPLGGAVAQALIGLLSTDTGGPYGSERSSFLTFSARMWSLLTLCRVAAETPERLNESTEPLESIALDTTFPHVAIRDLAIRTLLHIYRHDPTLITADVTDLRAANTPRTYRVAPTRSYGRTAAFIDVGTTFDFDSMDTLRYWYPTLADVFDLDTEEIAERADRWITGIWGRNNEEVRKDREAKWSSYDYNLTSNDHGAYPVVETLHRYLEYHAMLTVAGELADSGYEAVAEPYDDREDPWTTWLGRHLEYDDGLWLSDLRSPPPLRPEVYGGVPTDEDLPKFSESDFDGAIGVGASSIVDWLIVDGSISTYQSGRHRSVHVSSALVPPETSRALLRALELSETRDAFLPISDPVEAEPLRTAAPEPGFVLTGWLVETNRASESIERHDPFAHELPSEPTIFGRDFSEYMGLIPDGTGTKWHSPTGDEVAEWTSWSDSQLEVRGGESDSSSGHLTRARLEAVLDFLSAKGVDLILRVFNTWSLHANRTLGDDRYGESHKFYLLRSSGLLETLERRRRIGPADRGRA